MHWWFWIRKLEVLNTLEENTTNPILSGSVCFTLSNFDSRGSIAHTGSTRHILVTLFPFESKGTRLHIVGIRAAADGNFRDE